MKLHFPDKKPTQRLIATEVVRQPETPAVLFDARARLGAKLPGLYETLDKRNSYEYTENFGSLRALFPEYEVQAVPQLHLVEDHLPTIPFVLFIQPDLRARLQGRFGGTTTLVNQGYFLQALTVFPEEQAELRTKLEAQKSEFFQRIMSTIIVPRERLKSVCGVVLLFPDLKSEIQEKLIQHYGSVEKILRWLEGTRGIKSAEKYPLFYFLLEVIFGESIQGIDIQGNFIRPPKVLNEPPLLPDRSLT